MSHLSPQATLRVEGMNCANCALGIERHLNALGLSRVAVNFATSTARFALPPERSLEDIAQEIRQLGYTVPELDAVDRESRFSSLEGKFLFSLLFTIPLMLPMLLPVHGLHDPFVQLGLSLPVFLVGLHHFGKSALASLRARVPNMDVLIVVGTTAAFFYSLYGTIFGLGSDFLFYETAATISTIVLFGNLLEKRAVRMTTSALQELTALQVVPAKRVSTERGAAYAVVDSRELQAGDVVQVDVGDRVPADGEVVLGSADIDESMVTGESVPVSRALGAMVIGGTVVVQGNIRVRASAVGDATVLSNIIRLVEQAEGAKPPLQKLADRISSIFVPCVGGIALLTFLFTLFLTSHGLSEALLRSIAVLVIACPCALGLATPTAVMVGLGRAAKLGILAKGGDALERLANARAFLFDKTGTLTTGAFRLDNISTKEDLSQVQSIIRALEQNSSHPIAKSLVAALSHVPPHEFRSVREEQGRGMSGEDINGQHYELGAARLLLRGSSEVSGDDLVLLRNGKLLAALRISDEVKPEATQVIQRLRHSGARTIIVSGDRSPKVQQIAQALGVDESFAEQSPEEKLRTIETLERSTRTAFIGDGINDAPALARAHIGISLSGATQVAIQSAQIVLVGGNLHGLPRAQAISRLTVSTIRQNLFWAFFYNILAIPIAALGFLTPTVAAFAMALSDVLVIGNSLRLRFRSVD